MPHTIHPRLAAFGESIFTTMSRLAVEHKAVNLGQGFPDFDAPEVVKQAAIDAINAGHSQYARAAGLPHTVERISERMRVTHGFAPDPMGEVTLCAGCCEALTATIIGLCGVGDEVILLDPCYDSYAAAVAMAGATAVRVPMQAPDFRIERHALAAAITPRTKLILLNSPHNPTGRIATDEELRTVAELAIRHDLVVMSDEVYEEIRFTAPHRSIACLPGMRERTVIVTSMGKTFSVTGWRLGWAVAPPPLTAAVRATHQFLTFCAPTPFVHAAAVAIDTLADPHGYGADLRRAYTERRAIMHRELSSAGLQPLWPEGAYFMLASVEPWGFTDDVEAATTLVREAGVAAIPCSAFYDAAHAERRYLRFAFCKQEATMLEAGRRLRDWVARRSSAR
jgi:aspartate/methionine/tyrosine aminotransferase